MSGDEVDAAVARVAWEVEHNPDGPIAQAVGRAARAAERFGQAFSALDKEARGDAWVHP